MVLVVTTNHILWHSVEFSSWMVTHLLPHSHEISETHTLKADSSSCQREMKTTLCTADDYCHLSSLQVSSSGSTCWVNRGKCAGWHSGKNYQHLTSYGTTINKNKQPSVQSYRYWSFPCGQKISAFQQIEFFSIVWFHTLLPVRASLPRQPPVPQYNFNLLMNCYPVFASITMV